MTDIIDTVQLQETGESLVFLYEITLPNNTVVYLTNTLDGDLNSIYFPSKTLQGGTYPLKEYLAIPIELKGIAVKSSGAANRPTLTVANIPVLSRSLDNDEDKLKDILQSAGLLTNEDLLGCRVVYRRTLHSKTFTSTDSNPSNPPVEFPSQTYIIDRITGENNIAVGFELANPADLEGVQLPGRALVGKYCPWKYQGYFDDPPEGGCSWPLDSNNRFYDQHDNRITGTIPTYDATTSNGARSVGYKTKTVISGHTKIWEAIRAVPAESSNGEHNPLTSGYYWKRLDVCGKTLNSCKVRFQDINGNGTLEQEIPLPFGGFPATKTFK